MSPAVARRRPTAIFVRGATARAEPETFVYSLKARTRRRQGVARRHPASWSLVKRLMSQASAVGPLGHSTFDLATCRSNCILRCATSRHAMPCAPCAITQCHARPARPRDMQCHAHPMPCTPFLTFVKHSAHFLCMHALEYSAPGVCLCAEIVSRWSAHQRLSGMVRVSDVPHWTQSAGTIPPPLPHTGWAERAEFRV